MDFRHLHAACGPGERGGLSLRLTASGRHGTITAVGLIRLGRLIELAAVASDGTLPTEFRVFRAGVNDTAQGPILFDEGAAASVMAAFERGGVDLMIDLAHISVDEEARVERADADDARGWCRLEVREGPELWAVAVTWTPDGARRLTERTQRYISPVVFVQDETNRALEVFNLALCSMPATYHAAPLVAARKKLAADVSANTRVTLVDAALCDRFPPGDDGPWVYSVDVFDDWLVYDRGGELWRVSYALVNGEVSWGADDTRVTRSYVEEPKLMNKRMLKALARTAFAAAKKGDEAALVALEMTPEQAKKAIAAVKEQSGDAALALVESLLADALGAGDMGGESEAPAEPLEDAPAEPNSDEEKAAMAALRSILRVNKGVDLVGEVKRLTSEVAAIRLEREAETRNERLDLIGELVKLGAELPGTAWKDADKREPVDALASMPIAALRSRVAAFRAAPRAPGVRAPETEAVELTAKERELAAKMTPEQRARFEAARSARRAK